MVGVRPTAAAIAVLAAGTAFLGGTFTTGPAAAAGRSGPTDEAAAVAAARWQAGELVDGGIPGMGAGPDWGLTADSLVALEATGAAPEQSEEATAALKAHVRDYNSNDAWGPKGQRIAGATAKLLYAAVATGSDPAAFGAYDLRQETLDLVAGPDAGLENGRVKDRVDAPAKDSSNTFAQSLAVVGLTRSGGAPQSTVSFLMDQQCAAGGFRLYPYAFGGSEVTGDCDAQGSKAVLDPDSTAMAVQALVMAAADGDEGAEAAAEKGARWLAQKQAADGSFGGSGPTAAANTNSTGLASQALAATGHQAEADRAAGWLRRHQLTGDNAGKAADDIGAIAYNQDSLTAAQDDGIASFQRDQWRRATPQALLGLAQVSLGAIGTTDPDPGPEPTPTASGTPAPSPTAGTPSPSGSPSPTTGASTPAGPAGTTGGPGGADPGAGGVSGGGGALASTGTVPVLPYVAGSVALTAMGLVLHGVTRRTKGTRA